MNFENVLEIKWIKKLSNALKNILNQENAISTEVHINKSNHL